MEAIKEEIEELILEVMLFGQNPNDIETPSDILDKLRYDAIDEIKDRLWDLIKFELDYKAIFEEIEKHKQQNYEEDDEEDKKSDSDSDSD